MALNINGTTGISGVDGSNSAPALTGTDSNTGFNFGTDIIDLNTGGQSRFKIGAAGQLGVAGANYGTSGQALVSQGASAAPQWADVGGGGKIQQVKQAFKTSSFSSNAHLGTYADITGLSLTMQVASSTSKILFLGDICYQYPHDLARGITFQLLDGSTSIGDSTAYASFKGIQSANYNFNPSHTNQGLYMLSFAYLYTPGNTNNNTYKMRATGLNTSANTSWYWSINEMRSAYGNGGTSHLTAMEVAP